MSVTLRILFSEERKKSQNIFYFVEFPNMKSSQPFFWLFMVVMRVNWFLRADELSIECKFSSGS